MDAQRVQPHTVAHRAGGPYSSAAVWNTDGEGVQGRLSFERVRAIYCSNSNICQPVAADAATVVR